MLAILFTLAAAQAATSPTPQAAASSAPPACAAPAKPPRELAGWSAPRAIAAATIAQELGVATLAVGTAARATLAPTPRIAYPVQPEHAGTAATHGGLFAFIVTDAGTYRIALGAAAWIDLVADGKTVLSSAHAHGPDCTGVRKLVDFPLRPGRYLLQVSGATDPAITVMIARLPV